MHTDLTEAVEIATCRETGEVDSERQELAELNATVGGGSSSVMIAVTCWMPHSVPLLIVVISTMMVSSFSSSVSCAAVRVAEPLRLPGGMTMELVERV